MVVTELKSALFLLFYVAFLFRSDQLYSVMMYCSVTCGFLHCVAFPVVSN